MAKIIIDLSGTKGLMERHQGDLNDTSVQPQLRYLGEDGSFADGIFNPFKLYGYMSPAVNDFDYLGGTVNKYPINSIQYDPAGDTVYMSEEGENILSLNGLDDTTATNYLTLTSGYDIKDMLIYEVNGKKSVVFAVDTNTEYINAPGNVGSNTGGMYLGYKTIDTTEGATVLERDVTALTGTTQTTEFKIVDASSYSAFTAARKIAQQFYGGDVFGQQISGVSIAMRRSGGTGAGITMKVSIYSSANPATGVYTDRGAWSNAVTNYVINDTVTNGGIVYQCWTAHDAAATANDEPGVGSSWRNYWNVFGSPSSTVLASQTFSLSDIPVLSSKGEKRYTLEFTAPISTTNSTYYWLVIEEVGSVMTASDSLAVLKTTASNGLYSGNLLKQFNDAATDYWRDNTNPSTGNGDLESMDFRFILNRRDNWTAEFGSYYSGIVGKFPEETGQNTFLYLADNGLLYWFVGNHVHTIDGSVTGGDVGKATEDVLLFPSYITVADVAETRSRMYIGIQATNIAGLPEYRNFGSSKIGVYVWDRRSQIQGTSDFYQCPGAQEIKSVFVSSTGDVKVITIGNSGAAEIRGISGNQFAVLHTFEGEGYPTSRRGVSQIDNMTVWLGANGIMYAYGSVTNNEKAQLYKIGTLAGETGAGLETGAIFIGNEETTEPRIAVLMGWNDVNYQDNLVDSYPESNYDSYALISSTQEDVRAQTFVASGGGVLSRAKFYINKQSATGGTLYAELYETSGGVPVGSPVATSAALTASTQSSSFTLVSFVFTDGYRMIDGTTYAIGINGSTVTGGHFGVGLENTTPTHTGVNYSLNSGTWTAPASNDLIFYVYSGYGGVVSKWYPNGDGTINADTQTPNQGDIYTKVYTLPSLSTVKYIRLMMAKGNGSTGSTVVANLKCYYNQSTTAAWTKAITFDDVARGWLSKEINKNNVNFIQFEIEYVTGLTIGNETFYPMYIEMEYDDERRINP